MNKKLFLFGAAALIAFMSLTAFGGKTKAEQEAAIQQAITTQLDSFRVEQHNLCTERVMAEAQMRFDSLMAEKAAMAKPGSVKKTVKKSGPKVDPVPAAKAPTTTPKQDKMQGGTNVEEKKEKMSSPAPNTDKKKAKMGGGGK